MEERRELDTKIESVREIEMGREKQRDTRRGTYAGRAARKK